MLFLLDENVHVGVGIFLQGKGHDVKRVPAGIKNGKVIALACKENRVLLTQDKDFLDSKRYPPAKTPGIVCIRIHPPTLEQIAPAIARMLQTVPGNGFSGGMFLLEENGWNDSRSSGKP